MAIGMATEEVIIMDIAGDLLQGIVQGNVPR
jgi:hypothetical protein